MAQSPCTVVENCVCVEVENGSNATRWAQHAATPFLTAGQTDLSIPSPPQIAKAIAGKQLGGRAEAVQLSMTGICKRHSIEPFVYLADGLRQFPTTPPDRLTDLTELLPDVWFQAHPTVARRRTV
jgi:hypothetical protein